MDYTEWVFHDIEPIYLQLAHKLKYAILSGEICSGEHIPSARKMAGILHLNSNTVLKSYKTVEESGLIICSKNGVYTVVQDKVYIEAEKESAMNQLCCNYFSKMFELSFTKSEALMFIQDFCKKLTCHE